MKVTKMPFTNNVFILSKGEDSRPLTIEEWLPIAEWLNKKGIPYNMQSSVLTLPRDIDVTHFVLKWGFK